MDGELKGDLAEAIVRFMFRGQNNRAAFAIETTDGRASLFRYLRSCSNLKIDFDELDRHLVKKDGVPIPDLAIVTYQKGLELLEVKYRANGIVPDFEKDVAEIWRVWQCRVMLVSRDKYAEFGNFAVIDAGNVMTAVRVPEIKHWGVSEANIKECEKLVANIFSKSDKEG